MMPSGLLRYLQSGLLRFLIYLFIGILGLVLFFAAPHLHEWFAPNIQNRIRDLEIGEVLHELGAVLFVTVVVAATVGEYSLWILAREVEEKLTIKIRKVFDDPLLSAPLENVFDPNFVRPWYKLTLTLEPLEGHQDFLKVSLKNEYVVTNVSGRKREFRVVGWLDDILRPNDEAGFRHFKCGSPGKELTELDVKTYEVLQQGRISLEKLTDPPLEHEDSLQVSIEGMQFNRREDLLVFHMVAVTGELDICIKLSGGLTFNELDVYPQPLHHVSHEDFMKTLDVDEKVPNVKKYKIAHVLLPYQGVEVRWMPPTPEQQPASADE